MSISTWIVSNKLWILLGLAAAFNCFWIVQYKERLRIKGTTAVALGVIHMLCGVLFTKAFAFMEGMPGGMSLYGGVFFVPITLCLIARLTQRNAADVCDVFTIPTIVAISCGRINCLFSGCCLGTVISGTEGLRWPTREAELIFYLVLYILLRNKIGKPKYEGKLYPIYMISYGAFRFVVEWFRETENMVGFAHLSHIWSITAMAIGALVIYLIDKGKSQKKSEKKL